MLAPNFIFCCCWWLKSCLSLVYNHKSKTFATARSWEEPCLRSFIWHRRQLRLSLGEEFLPGVWGWKVIPCSSFGELSTSLSPLINQPLTTDCLPCGWLILSEHDSSCPPICPPPSAPLCPAILFLSHSRHLRSLMPSVAQILTSGITQ